MTQEILGENYLLENNKYVTKVFEKVGMETERCTPLRIYHQESVGATFQQRTVDYFMTKHEYKSDLLLMIFANLYMMIDLSQ